MRAMLSVMNIRNLKILPRVRGQLRIDIQIVHVLDQSDYEPMTCLVAALDDQSVRVSKRVFFKPEKDHCENLNLTRTCLEKSRPRP